MKQQQRKTWESYVRICFPTLIGAGITRSCTKAYCFLMQGRARSYDEFPVESNQALRRVVQVDHSGTALCEELLYPPPVWASSTSLGKHRALKHLRNRVQR